MKIYLENEIILLKGRTENHKAHKHYAIQIIFHKDEIDVNGKKYSSPVFINSQVEHSVKAPFECISLLIDPKTLIGRTLIVEMKNETVSSYPLMNSVNMDAFPITSLLGNNFTTVEMDERIEEILKYIDLHIVDDLNINHLSTQVQLSSTRFRHLFKEVMGISVIRYLMWRKLILAAKDIFQNDLTITQGAYKYGFSDDAHFSRLFKKTFGINLKKILLSNIE
jgi:AraC-like DNA-binding protein